jgi:hypothetical protein
VSPSRRRAAVLMLQDRLGTSERRACQIAGQHRSTQRREPVLAQDDAAVRSRLRRLSRDRPRWGYRRAHAELVGEGWQINRKRVQRVWREESRSAGESVSVSGTPRFPRAACARSAPIMCGRLTFSSTRPPTGTS